MKRIILVLVVVIGAGAFGAYGQTKNDDIIKLLRVSGSDKMADQIMTAMIAPLKQSSGVPDAFWVKFRKKLNVDELLYACVPAYDKYYTHDEIKQLIKFYESPLGKKMVAVAPLLVQETMAIGQKWGEKLGQEIYNELVKEGYLQ